MDEKKKWWEFDSAMLHILAMVLMVFDHTWGTLLGNFRWMTAVGRVAFPIFAFMIVEGFFHTSNVKKYMKRLLVFALISEIPFDFMMSGHWFGLWHQNVLWTFLFALLLILLIEKIKGWITKATAHISNELAAKIIYYVIYIAACFLVLNFANLLGNITMVDYFGGGIVTVLVFYILHERKWWALLLQIILLYYVNVELIGGMVYQFNLFGINVDIAEQALALIALIPIWLYRGKQGYHEKWFRNFCYWFYPAHMFILFLIRVLVYN